MPRALVGFLLVVALAGAFPNRAAFVGRQTSLGQGRPSNVLASRQSLEFPDDASSSDIARGISSHELREMSQARRRRLAEEKEQKSRFVTGDALHQLRQEVLALSEDLHMSRLEGDEARVSELEQAIWHAQQVDAEYVYQVSLQRAQVAEATGLVAEAHKYRREAERARNALPQFNLEGLWVGKYGDHGFEMINVTYQGDILIAHKLTGDETVPKGEISFSVDLSVISPETESSSSTDTMLEPIELTDDAAEQWGSKFLQRFPGRGQVASPGYVQPQWLEGQMILVNQYFSFAWLPIGHQVFFGRPSPELTLKLLRESRSKEHSGDQVRDFLTRCMEETELLEDDLEVSDGVFHSNCQQDYYEQEGCFE